jgi:lambda family phage portal protein
MPVSIRLNLIDRAIGLLGPRLAYRRGIARAALDAARVYDGATVGRRTDGWRTPRSSADAEIARYLPLLRNRSRDLNRNNPHARKAKSVLVSNIVGTGIWPRSRSAEANALFKEWAKVCDADGQLDFAGVQRLIVGEMVEAGDGLIRRRLRRPEDGLPVPLQLQVNEGDLLDESRSQDLGPSGKIVNGVEFNPIGQRRAYWMFADHPGNASFVGGRNLLSRAVPASEIIHLYDKERMQVRGVPWCSPIIMPVRDLADYGDAERWRKKIEACVVAFVLGNGTDDADRLAPTTREDLAITDKDGNPIEQFEPGLIAYSNSGRTVQFNNPTQSGGFVDYMKIGLHEVAAGYDMPYELLTGDLAEVNFSSYRAGFNQFKRVIEMKQWLSVIPMALNPIWDWFCEAAFLTGKLSDRFIPVEWDPPVFESVQPLDDANADIAIARAGLDSPYSIIARRTGRDPEEVLQEWAEFGQLVDRLQLVLDSDPRHTSSAGLQQSSQADRPPQQRTNPRLVA